MKRILVLAFLAAVLANCQQPKQEEGFTQVIGTLAPVEEGKVILSFGSFLDSTKLSKEGVFEFRFQAESGGPAMLMFGKSFAQIYLEPGKTLNLEIDSKSFPENISFSGELGPVNNYLVLARKLDRTTAINTEELYGLTAERFIQLTDSIHTLKLQLLKEYVMRYPEMDSGFVGRHKTDIEYNWANQRLLYPAYNSLLSKKPAVLPYNYHSSLFGSIDINNPNLLVSPAFQNFLENYLDFKQTLYLKDNPSVEKLWFPESVARFRVIQQEFTDTLVKDYVLYTSMDDHLDNFGTEHLETFLTNFQIHCKNKEYLSLIDLKLQNLKNLERGLPAPDFTAFDPEGKKVSLADFQGSLLYINLWASWSNWSLQEIPWWEDLIRKFDGRPVQFVSVSLDFAKDLNNWKYILEDKKLGGTHLIQDPETTVWQDQYYIQDLPRYLLIDREGKIISVHAPRPSENMVEVLENLLKE